ncbi:phosphoribosylglycinamide formyltransferase [Sphingomonas citri]|jgi:phosphoribosylglycinamide formyltransferase 1|uniref:Phosphoribosylglycinamide formyltransferase n=1 Tax=Sphingomonas citri TaxID=2862499 RepID=A0ABS7BI45_9SPHN|nr:phosphoribosylglycinamide formyltransferase [Sphingomonas citri]MBW6529281.1 phosphoribosylglycinamide formyltransferase [Sphingomonas citri]
MSATVRVAVLVSGRGSNMRSLAAAAGDAYEIALVASDKPEAAGLAWAREQGLATFALSPRGIGKPAYEAALDAALREAGVEVIALAGYMRLLSDDLVTRWRGRIINIHPSLLPKYKGLDTHARAIAAGDAVAGCSVHVVTEELDGGAVLGQAEVPIEPGDTPDTLAERVLSAEHRLYPEVLARFVREGTWREG